MNQDLKNSIGPRPEAEVVVRVDARKWAATVSNLRKERDRNRSLTINNGQLKIENERMRRALSNIEADCQRCMTELRDAVKAERDALAARVAELEAELARSICRGG